MPPRRRPLFALMSKTQFADLLQHEGPQAIRIKLKRTQGGEPREVTGILTLAPAERARSLADGIVTMEGSGHLSDEDRFNELVAEVTADLGHGGTTGRRELNALGLHYFGRRYAGTYARSEDVPLSNSRPLAIVNVDDSPGSHWLGAYRLHGGRVLMYDSFGRPGHQIAYAGAEMTEDDPEQLVEQLDCGQRCMAWLRLADERGSRAARRI